MANSKSQSLLSWDVDCNEDYTNLRNASLMSLGDNKAIDHSTG